MVRHQLPKLTLAGSSPVARSSKKHKHGTITVPCFFSIKSRDSNPTGHLRKHDGPAKDAVFLARTSHDDRSAMQNVFLPVVNEFGVDHFG